MKKSFIILLTLLSSSLMVNAQKEYRLAKTTGQLKLNINGAIVEGYDGKEIIFSSQNTITNEVDERAKGLVAISGSGYTDNTGMGISVTDNGQEVSVNTVSKKPIGILTIRVPQNIKVSFTNNSSLYHEELILKNLKGEIEVSASYNKIKLENNTGPMNIKSVYGSVDASFNSEIKGPISIISVYDYVDIALPASSKANIELGTSYGKLYSGKEFSIDIDKNVPEKKTEAGAYTIGTSTTGSGSINTVATGREGLIREVYINNGNGLTSSIYSGGDRIKGKLNGGGVDLIFKSTYKNVYLRQK